MLTIIGIGIPVLGLFGYWLSKSIVVTEAATFTVVADISKENPTRFLEPGWGFIFWPFERVMVRISTEVQSDNIASQNASCLVDDPINKGQSTYRENALGLIETAEISLEWNFQVKKISELKAPEIAHLRARGIRLSEKDQLANYFTIVTSKPNAPPDLSKVREILKDMVQEHVAAITQTLQLYEAINFTTPASGGRPKINHMEPVKAALQMECLEKAYPIKIGNLKRNAPFTALGVPGTAIEERTAASVMREAKMIQRQTELDLAKIDVQIADEKGKAKVIEIAALVKAFGLSELPKLDQVRHLLDLRALEVYEEMAKSGSSKFVVLPDILGKIGNALATVKKG